LLLLLPLTLAVLPLLGGACSTFGADPEHAGPTPDADASTSPDGTDPVKGAPDRGLTITVGEPKATAFVVQNGALDLPVKLTRRESTTGAVVVTVTNLPPDVTAEPLTIPTGKTEGTLTLKAKATSLQGAKVADVSALEEGPLGSGASTNLTTFVRGAPGAVDTTFGDKGVLRHIVGPTKNAVARSLVVMPDDRLMAVGDCPNVACVARASAGGLLDTSYGTAGTAAILAGIVGQAAADPAGGLLLSSNRGANQVGLARLTDTGQPDTTFGDGTVFPGVVSFAAILEGARTSLAVRSDGTAIVGYGYSHLSGITNVALAMFTSKGIPVTTFGTGGIFQGAQLLNFTAPAIGLRASGDIWTTWVGPDACPVGQQTGATGAGTAGFGGLAFICAPAGSPPDANWRTGSVVALPSGSLVAAFHKGTNVLVAKGVPDGSTDDPTWGNGFGGTTITEDAIPSLSVDSRGLVLVALLRPGGLRFARMTATGA